jgi:hypothetical protein
MSVTFRPAVQDSPLKRRFYHLGMERSDRPPRDFEDSSVPPSERLSYAPRTFGDNEEEDMQRLTLFDASGEAPPKPHYLTDIDRARHFVHLLGGMDVAPHFASRPSFLLCRGGSLPMQHSELYKSVLAARSRELSALQLQLSERAAARKSDHATEAHRPSPLLSPTPAEPSSLQSPSPTASIVRRDGIPASLQPGSSQTSTNHPRDKSNSSSPVNLLQSPDTKSKKERMTKHLTSFEVSSLRLPSASPSGGILEDAGAAASSPCASPSIGSLPLSSLEVALSSSKQHASSVVRHFRKLQEQRRELQELSRAHHPNQVITYVEH